MDRGSGALTNAARIILGAGAVVAALGAVVAYQSGAWFIALEVAVVAVVLGATAAYEHGRYRARTAAAPGTRYQRTEEVFTDPTTGQLTRVWYDPVSGARDYRPDV